MNRTTARTVDKRSLPRITTALSLVLSLMAMMLVWQLSAAPKANANELINESFSGSSVGAGWSLLPTTPAAGNQKACLTDATSGPLACIRDANLTPQTANGLGTPAAGGNGTGFLQLTSNRVDDRGGAIYNAPIDASSGLRIEFKQYQYGNHGDWGQTRRPGDGISFFLVDGATSLTNVGAFGGALGYGFRKPDSGAGIAGGYLGIGLDTYGNYANTGHVGGPSCSVAPGDTMELYSDVQGRNPATLPFTNTIGLRGPGSQTDGYCLIAAKKLDTPGADGSSATSWGAKSLWADINTPIPSHAQVNSAARNVRIVISPNPNPTVSVYIDFSGTGTNFEHVMTEPLPTNLPPTFKFGFAASTGSASSTHLISNLSILGGPVAENDSKSLARGATANFGISTLVTPGPLPFPATGAYGFVDPQNPAGPVVLTRVVPGEGTWTVNPNSGATTFAPLPNLSTPVTPIKYRVTDTSGGTAEATLAVIYGPSTGNVTRLVGPGVTAAFPAAALGTSAGSGTITGYKLLHPTSGNPIPSNTFTDAHGGIWTMNPVTGATSYAADANYRGPVPSISYRVTDSNDLSADGVLSIRMGPDARDQNKTASRGSNVSFTPLSNLVTAGSSSSLTLTLSAPDVPGGTVKTVPGQGTWTLNSGTFTFVPSANFTGAVTPLSYVVTDANSLSDAGTLGVQYPPAAGNAQKIVQPGATATFPLTDLNVLPGSSSALTYGLMPPGATAPVSTYTDAHGGVWTMNPTTGATTYAASATYRGPVAPIDYRVTDGNSQTAAGQLTVLIPPAADDKALPGTPNTPVTFDPIGDLVRTGSSTTLTIELVAPDSGAPNKKTVSGEGVWTLNPTTGKITFTPALDFSGPVTPIEYRVTDDNFQTDVANLVVVYGPQTGDAVKVIQPGATATFATSDLATIPGSNGTLSFTLLTPGTGVPVTTYTDVHGGVWTINPGTGATSYVSSPSYRGPVPPLKYRVTDGAGATADGNLEVLMPPTAADQNKASNPGLPVAFNPVADLVAEGSDDLLTISLVTPDPANPNKKTVPGEGAWTLVPGTGVITFTPESGFVGNPTPIDYRVIDRNNLSDKGTLGVTYNKPPTAPDETVTVNPGKPAVLKPVVTPGTSTNITVYFNTPDPGETVRKTVPGEGVWTINPSNHHVTFTPELGFTDNPTPVEYTVEDANGLKDTGTLTVKVNVPPVAENESKSSKGGKPVTFDPLKDLVTPGTDSSLKVELLDPKTGKPVPGDLVEVPGEGTWTVDQTTGKVTFTPEDGYTGTSTISYRVKDGNTLVDEAELSAKVTDSDDDGKGDGDGDDPKVKDKRSKEPTPGDGGDLAETGAFITAAIVGGGLLILGAGLVLVARRRRTA